MKRYLIFLTMLIFIFLPVKNTLAFTDGLLSGKTTTEGSTALTDGATGSPTIFAEYEKPIIFKFDYAEINTVKLFTYRQSSTGFELYLDGMKVYEDLGSYEWGENPRIVPNVIANELRLLTTTSASSTQYSEVEVYGDYVEYVSPYKDVNSLTYTSTHESVLFSWENPINTDIDLSGTKVYKNDSLIKTLGATETNYEDLNLQPETTYKYKFVSVYANGLESPGVEKTITTAQEPPKPGITELEYNPSYYSVSFTWNNPTEELFSGVEVYRDGELISTTDTETSAFEDKNLTPETNYSYEFIAAYSDGRKGEAATIGVVTSAEPIPVFKSAGYEIDSTGNFIFKWTEPTTGDVKILIDGDEYTTAPAEPQQVTIPKEDIVTDSLGNPLVTLTPVTSYGTQGEPVEIEGQNVKIPFDVKGLLESGMGLLWIIGPFLLLALSFLLAPKLINLVSQAFKGKM